LLFLSPSVQRWPIPFAPLSELLKSLAALNSTVPLYCDISRSGDGTKLAQSIDAVDLSSTVLLGGLTGDSLIEAIAIARINKQVHLVTNGLKGIGEIAMAVGSLGADRVLFGSEAPIRSMGASLSLIRRAGLSPSDLELVLGGNAKRILAAGGVAK
jgi:hypothetical protein